MAIYLTSCLKRLKGNFAGNVLKVSTGIAVGQGIAMAASPIITRLYVPGDFGVLEVYGSLLAIFVVAASWKYEGAILLPESDITAANVFALCIVILLIMTAFTGFFTWIYGDKLLALIKAKVMGPYIWLLPVGVFGAGTYQVLNFWGIRQKAFGTIAWTKISQNTGKAAAMIGLGSFGLGPAGLLVGEIIGQCSGSTRLAISAWRQDKHSFRLIKVRQGLKVLQRYKKFPFFTLGAQSLHTLGMKVPYLLLAAIYGLQVVGWFALAQWIIGTPIGLIGASVAQVYAGELTHLTRQSPQAIRGLFLNTLKMLSLITLAIVLLIFFAAPLLIPLIFGRDWRESAVYIQVLSFMFACQLISYPLMGTVDFLNCQGLGLAREILRAILMIGAIPLAAALKQPAVVAVLFYGIAGGIVYLIGLALSWYAIKMHNTALVERSV
jgi:O-antigen/teichoic acid export membrane protein